MLLNGIDLHFRAQQQNRFKKQKEEAGWTEEDPESWLTQHDSPGDLGHGHQPPMTALMPMATPVAAPSPAATPRQHTQSVTATPVQQTPQWQTPTCGHTSTPGTHKTPRSLPPLPAGDLLSSPQLDVHSRLASWEDATWLASGSF